MGPPWCRPLSSLKYWVVTPPLTRHDFGSFKKNIQWETLARGFPVNFAKYLRRPFFYWTYPVAGSLLNFSGTSRISRSSRRRCSVKKVFLKILQNLQENICARVSILKKLQGYNMIWYIYDIMYREKDPQIKLQRLWKVWKWIFGLLVQLINSLEEVLILKKFFQKTKLLLTELCYRSILFFPFYLS